MARRRRVVAAAACLAAMVAAGGLGHAVWAAQQHPTFRVVTHYVQLDVVVTDGDNRPVKNLTKDDFVITEHGRRQEIADFAFTDIPPVHRTVASVKAATPAMDVVSNTHPPLGRQWVLLIDDLHLFEQRIVEIQRVIATFLERLPPSDTAAVVFTGRSDLSVDFTSDLGSLMRTGHELRDALGFALDTPFAWGGAAGAVRVSCALRAENARRTVDVVRNVTSALATSTYPRRAIVWVMQGLDYDFSVGATDDRPGARPVATLAVCPHEALDARDVLGQLQQLFERARQADVPVYTVDPRGVLAPEDVTRHGTADRISLNAEVGFLHMVAEGTGGRAFVNRGDVTRAMDELVADNGSYYLLGY